MSLYPSLEDMKVDHMAQAQAQAQAHGQQSAAASGVPVIVHHQVTGPQALPPSLYPSLHEFMGMEISEQIIQANMPESGQAVVQYRPAGAVTTYSQGGMVAPVTGDQNMGLMRAEIKQGIRQVIACKGEDGKVGLRVQAVNKGVFVSFVLNGSPAALAGLRFGDQILQINGQTLAGFEKDKVMKLLKNASGQRIEFAVRDRPFERTLTVHKDSTGHVGFMFKDGKITAIVKDSSAARNGLLTEHNLLEVNGQNVVGMKDKGITEIMKSTDRTVTVTIMPSFIYNHMVKCMADSLVKKHMDHSIPEI